MKTQNHHCAPSAAQQFKSLRRFAVSVILLLQLLFFGSCEKDLYEDAIINASGLKDKAVIKQKTFFELSKDRNFINAYQETTRTLNEKLATDRIIFGVEVDTTIINEITKGDYKSYSFRALSPDESEYYFKNLVIEIDSLQRISAMLMKYYRDDQKKLDSIQASIVIPKAIDLFLDVNGEQRCSVVEIIHYGPCGLPGNHYADGDLSECTGNPTTETEYSMICTVPNFQSVNYTLGPIHSGNNYGYGAGSGNGSVGMVPPKTMTCEEKRKKDFEIGLDETTRTWYFALTSAQKTALLNFLKSNAGSSEAPGAQCEFSKHDKKFAFEAIVALHGGGIVEYQNRIILSPSFVNQPKIKCIFNKLRNAPSDNLLKNMLSQFKNSTNKNLKFTAEPFETPEDFKITSNFTPAYTDGNPELENDYTIVVNSNLENFSNLTLEVALCHEMIHALMFSTLEEWGYMTFDSVTGNPQLTPAATQNCSNYLNVSLNSLSTKLRFEALICAITDNGNNLQVPWTHELFNQWNFEIHTYRDALELFMLYSHDWQNESGILQIMGVQTGGADWKQKLARAMSWTGLEVTPSYQTYHSTAPADQLEFTDNIGIYLAASKKTCP